MTDETPTLAERLARYREEWLWHEADDERRKGHGHHMGQMLYRLPVDGQTRDMKASIESMIADLETLVATPVQPAVPVEALAEAWQRGHNSGAADSAVIVGWAAKGAPEDERPAGTPNPYRAEPAPDEGGKS